MDLWRVEVKTLFGIEYEYEYDVFQHVVALSLLSNNHGVKNTKLLT